MLIRQEKVKNYLDFSCYNNFLLDCALSCRWNVMNMNHRHLVEAGARIEMDGKEVEMPERPTSKYPDNYPFEIEIASSRSYGGENLEEFSGKTLVPPIIIN